MEAASSYLALMPITKQEIKTFSEKLIAEITAGFVDPLQVAVNLKAMEEVIATVRKDKSVQAEILAVVSRNNNKVEHSGATIEMRLKSKYHYEEDTAWSEINAQITALDAKRKEREAFLKALKQEVADPLTGEIISPILVESEETLVVTFKKQ